MELIKSVPITDINSESIKLELGGQCNYYKNGAVKFNITDVNLTEPDGHRNPLITNLARKKRIDVTISGYINEPFKVRNDDVKKPDPDRLDSDYVDIQDKNINITFHGVRVIREKSFNNELQQVINVPRLMIDNTHELYGFLKPLYVNKGEMSELSEQNIYLSFNEIVELLKDISVNLGVKDAGNSRVTVYNWITEYKKGDTNGVKSH